MRIGAGCQRLTVPPVEGEVFSLDIPFYRTRRLNNELCQIWSWLSRALMPVGKGLPAYCQVRPLLSDFFLLRPCQIGHLAEGAYDYLFLCLIVCPRYVPHYTALQSPSRSYGN